jgi:hypothetical protein
MMNYTKEVCIIIPMYKEEMTTLEIISYKRILKIFSSYKIYIVCPLSLQENVNLLAKNNDNVSACHFDNKFFKGIKGYNRLLMSYEFYSRFVDFKYVLICQLDVFVIKNDLDYWIMQAKDNIGAPIFEGYTAPTLIMKQKGNNGGFCLRNTKSCIKVLSMIDKTYSKLSTLWMMESIWYWKLFRLFRDGLLYNYNISFLKPILNEDMFWSVVVPDKFPWFIVCEPEIAKYFAYDANPRLLFEKCNYSYPMAIHAWWRYDKNFVLDIIKTLEKD